MKKTAQPTVSLPLRYRRGSEKPAIPNRDCEGVPMGLRPIQADEERWPTRVFSPVLRWFFNGAAMHGSIFRFTPIVKMLSAGNRDSRHKNRVHRIRGQ